MVIPTVKNNTHLLISVLPILFEIYDNFTDQSHLVNKSFTVYLVHEYQRSRSPAKRRIIDCVLCIFTLIFLCFFVLLFCTCIGVCFNNNNNNNNNYAVICVFTIYGAPTSTHALDNCNVLGPLQRPLHSTQLLKETDAAVMYEMDVITCNTNAQQFSPMVYNNSDDIENSVNTNSKVP